MKGIPSCLYIKQKQKYMNENIIKYDDQEQINLRHLNANKGEEE